MNFWMRSAAAGVSEMAIGVGSGPRDRGAAAKCRERIFDNEHPAQFFNWCVHSDAAILRACPAPVRQRLARQLLPAHGCRRQWYADSRRPALRASFTAPPSTRSREPHPGAQALGAGLASSPHAPQLPGTGAGRAGETVPQRRMHARALRRWRASMSASVVPEPRLKRSELCACLGVAPQRAQHEGGLGAAGIAGRTGGQRQLRQAHEQALAFHAGEGDVEDVRRAPMACHCSIAPGRSRQAPPQPLAQRGESRSFGFTPLPRPARRPVRSPTI